MTDNHLRAQVIRLAFAEPALRPVLLPILREGREFPNEKKLEEYLHEHPKADESKHWVGDKGDAKKDEAPEPKKDDAKKDEEPKPKKRGPRFSDAEKNLPWTAHQPVKDPDKLFEHAVKGHEQQLDMLNRGKGLDKVIGAMVKRCDKGDCEIDYSKPGPVILIGPLKKQERSKEKVETNFDGDWSQLTDIVRASVAVDSIDEVDDVIEKLRAAGMKLARPPNDRFENPTPAGYRDLCLNVEYPDGHVGELQVHVKSILKAKDKGHKYYEDVRSIGAKAKKEGRDTLTDEEQAKMDEAMNAMKKLYDDAFHEATRGKGGKQASRAVTAADITYYEVDGLPAKWEKGKFPVLTSSGGKEKTVYDIDKFFDTAKKVSKSEYDDIVEKVKSGGKGKKGSLREATIRLAHANPELRPLLLPLLREE